MDLLFVDQKCIWMRMLRACDIKKPKNWCIASEPPGRAWQQVNSCQTRLSVIGWCQNLPSNTICCCRILVVAWDMNGFFNSECLCTDRGREERPDSRLQTPKRFQTKGGRQSTLSALVLTVLRGSSSSDNYFEEWRSYHFESFNKVKHVSPWPWLRLGRWVSE